MKRLFHITMIFFSLALFFLLGQYEPYSQQIESISAIQNAKKETVVLISNNIFNGEFLSSEQKNGENFSGTTPLISTYQPLENLFNKNKTQLSGCFIHNLSTDKEKVHPIRAP